MIEPMQDADIGGGVRETTGRPTAAPELPDIIKARLRPKAGLPVARSPLASMLTRIGAAVGAWKTRLGAAPAEKPLREPSDVLPDRPAGTVREKVTATLAALPTWAALNKFALPKVPPHVRDGLVQRGRSAGMQIGTTPDKIVRPAPQVQGVDVDDAVASAFPIERDISTIAVKRSVKQPAIFAPGHLLTALLTGGIVHIATTFAITSLGTGSAYRQLRPVLPSNQIVVLPELQAGQQILPFLAPDMLYALCRFDLSGGPVAINAILPEAGWSLALYNRQGDNFYATPGQSLRPVPVAFLLEPASDRLVNLQPGVRKTDVDASQVTSPDSEGLVVIRAPLKGIAYQAATLADLKRATCKQVKR